MSLYIEHFGLRELPFRITPAVQFFYRGGVRGETLDALKYAINNGEGIMAVIGEVGTGKSMLCRMLMSEFKDKAQLAYIANPTFSDQEIIYHISEELGLDVAREHRHVARDLQHRLLLLHSQSKRIVVCIDEAQAMPDASLEQIRLLSNLESSNEKVVQIILFGQPELAGKLERRHMRQLRERITSTFYLRNLSTDQVREYISHRLKSAHLDSQREQDVFTQAATAAIAKVSQGILRRINILCDKAMLAAFADDSPTVTATHARRAARDARYRHMEEDPLAAKSSALRRKTVFAAGAAALALAAIAYQEWVGRAPAQEEYALVAESPAAAAAAPKPAPAPAPPVTVTVTEPAAPPVTITAAAAPAPAPAAKAEPAVAAVDNPQWRAYPPTSYLRQRLNATQTLFGLVADPGRYTARILSVPRERTVDIERYLRDLARFYTIRNVLIYPAEAENQKLFVITYGLFPSEFQAELFIHELPSFFRTNKPFVQALAVAQLEAGGHW